MQENEDERIFITWCIAQNLSCMLQISGRLCLQKTGRSFMCSKSSNPQEGLKTHGTCLRDNKSRYNQPRRFLQQFDYNFLTGLLEEPREALSAWSHAYKHGINRVRDRIGCRWWISGFWGKSIKTNSWITILDFRKTEFSLWDSKTCL